MKSFCEDARQFLDEEEVSGLTRDNYGVVVLYAQWSQGVARVAGKNYDTLQKAIDVVLYGIGKL